MSKNVKIANTTYNSVPSINIPLATGSGNASFFDVSDTTATAADVSTGKYFYTSAGVLTQGTNSGGGGEWHVGTSTMSNPDATNTSISFTGLSGTPRAFWVRSTSTLTRNSSYKYYYVATMRYNGTNTAGNRWYMYNGQFYNITTGYSYTYSNGTLTLSSSGSRTASPGSFYSGTYELTYIY